MCSCIRNYCKFKFQILGNRAFTLYILFLLLIEVKGLCEGVSDKTPRYFIVIEC